MKLSIIISNRNDVVMLSQTIVSAQEAIVGFGRELGEQVEIVIADNSDTEKAKLAKSVMPNISINNGEINWIQLDEPSMAYARMEAARQAKGEYLFCCDGHMQFGRDTIIDLVRWMDENKDKPVGFAHAPIRWAGHHRTIRRFQVHPSPDKTLWAGWWNKAPEFPHKISWKWMPWICNRDWYLNVIKGYGCLAEKKVSWGGAELLQQNKAWLMGYENWGIPTDPMTHVGPYSDDVRNKTEIPDMNLDPVTYKYRLYGNSGNHQWQLGVLVAFYVLMGDEGKDEVNKRKDVLRKHGLDLERDWPIAEEIGKEEREWFKSVQTMTYQELMELRPWDDL